MKWTTPSPTASPDMGCSVGRSHGSAEQGTGVYKVMASAFEATGGKPLTETIGVKLLTDTKGVVLGVIAKDKEGYFKIKAKVTILTCGGIQGNVEMMTKYVGPDSVYALQRGLLTNTGDGILMGMEVRAATKAMERVHGYVHIPPYPMPYPLDLYGAWLANGGEKLGRFMTCLNTTILMSNFAYCIVVNIRGERFADESRPRLGEQMCNAILRQPEVRAYVIADQPLYDKYLKTITENAANGLKALGYGPPQYATADKIEDLAIKVGINPSVLSSTVSEYNKAVAEGTTAFLKIPKTNKDPLGLYEKLKMNFLYKIETPPFYAVMVTSGVSHGHGGLDINGNCQVLDRENKVIPGLYAAGDNAVLYQGNYSGGYGQGLIQGYIAGKHAVASLK